MVGNRYLGPAVNNEAVYPIVVFADRLLLELAIGTKHRICWILSRRQVQAIELTEPLLAVRAVTDTVVGSTVIACLVAPHIEEDPIEVMGLEQLLDDLQRIVLLVTSIDTDVRCRCSLRSGPWHHGKPSRGAAHRWGDALWRSRCARSPGCQPRGRHREYRASYRP